jgi:type II secretory pathway predicted ATPase ExeA
MDYLSYWSLLRKPFKLEGDSSFFAGVPQREAIAGLNYFVNSPMNSAFLVARSGCGMTWLLRHVERMHGFDDCAAEVIRTDGTQLHHQQVRANLCEALGYQTHQNDGSSHLHRAIEASAQHGVQTIWLIDRCKAAAADVAHDLVMEQSNLSVVLGTTADELGKRAVEFGRCTMQIDLPALTLEETIEYVRYGLEQAGGTRPLFPDQAAVRLHEFTDGVLADLAVTAESALALAARHGLDQVTPATVEAVGDQLSRAA